MKGIKQASPPPPNFLFSRDIMLFFDEKIITSQDAGIFSSITAVLLSVMDGLVYKPGLSEKGLIQICYTTLRHIENLQVDFVTTYKVEVHVLLYNCTNLTIHRAILLHAFYQ